MPALNPSYIWITAFVGVYISCKIMYMACGDKKTLIMCLVASTLANVCLSLPVNNLSFFGCLIFRCIHGLRSVYIVKDLQHSSLIFSTCTTGDKC